MLILCAIPARAQIVSYLDANGKRIYINVEPKSPARELQPSPASAPGPKDAAKPAVAASHTTLTQPDASRMNGAESANREQIEAMIRETSARYHVDPALIRAVIGTESNWNPSAVSSKGALGLMQLVPGTAQEMGVNNAFDPKQNLDGGVRYLRSLLERYNGDLDKALAAYNAGPGAVDRAGGVPPYRETRAYVQKVTDSYYQPGSGRLSQAVDIPHPIYRRVETSGRVVFTNE